MSKKVDVKRRARERAAAIREAERRAARRRRWVTGTVVVVLVGVVAGLTTWALLPEDEQAIALPKPVSGTSRALPPWPVPPDTVTGARRAGLAVQPMEGTAKHFHAHLDIIVNGEEVPVPANLGIASSGAMSELHTHDARGVLHIEAPTDDKRYILGQLFSEWDVHLDADGIGGLEVDGENTLRAYVNGKRVTGNPAGIELTPHRQIALVYGPSDAEVDVPASYDFAPGE